MNNREAYDAYVEMCADHHWMATYWTLVEEGYDDTVDYITLIKRVNEEDV